MLVQIEHDARPIYFLSDAHLAAHLGPPEREDWLLDLLREVAERAGALFVLGDLFDFWFEYRQVVPKGSFRISRALREAVESGIPVIFLGGNHDFWAGDYLERELGLRVFQNPITVHLQGRRVYLAHGDGLGPGDRGYKVLKRILRHPTAIRAYRSLHPDLGIPLAHRVSALSRRHTEDPEVLLPKILRDVARPSVRGETTAMIMGHVHEPVHYSSGGRDFLLIGDWLENFTHVRMENGRFTLYRRDGNGHLPVPPLPWPPGLEPQGPHVGEACADS